MHQKRLCSSKEQERIYRALEEFFTDLPPASEYGGSYSLAIGFFDNPDELAEDFAELRLGCSEI
jgi:hypothetical protein